jgi:peptide chain release factor
VNTPDRHDRRDVLDRGDVEQADQVDLLLSAGRGPQECAWAVAELATRLEMDAAGNGLAVRRLESVPGQRRGTWQSVLVRVTGPGTGRFAATWSCTLCWQAPSPYRPGARRKNWYVTARRCDPHPRGTRFDEADVDVVACRTGGPGGQHRNKASTAARATHRPTGLVVVVDDERYFETNRRLALDLLRRRLAQADAAADRAAGAARRRMHDELVRGDPVRVEGPTTASATSESAPRRSGGPSR